MYSKQIATEAVKQCHACSAHLPATDNFCRCCGICQLRREPTADELGSFERDVTGGPVRREADQLLSSMLVRSLTKSVALRTAPVRCSRLGTRVVAALTLIPFWLLIIMLSPLDAYAAAKTASSRLNYE